MNIYEPYAEDAKQEFLVHRIKVKSILSEMLLQIEAEAGDGRKITLSLPPGVVRELRSMLPAA